VPPTHLSIRELSSEGVKVVEKEFIIGTPMGNKVETNSIYVRVGVSLTGYQAEVDMMPLELYDFDVILGMDWLSKYKTLINYYTKIVMFQIFEGRRMVFKGEKVTNPINLVSIVTARCREGRDVVWRRRRLVSCLLMRGVVCWEGFLDLFIKL